MDEWLRDRVDQLKLVNDELTRIADAWCRGEDVREMMSNLQFDVVRMIAEAEADYDAF
jgi:hypothetical protein